MTQVRRGNRTPSRAPASDTFDWFWSDFQLVESPQLEFESRVDFTRMPKWGAVPASSPLASIASRSLTDRWLRPPSTVDRGLRPPPQGVLAGVSGSFPSAFWAGSRCAFPAGACIKRCLCLRLYFSFFVFYWFRLPFGGGPAVRPRMDGPVSPESPPVLSGGLLAPQDPPATRRQKLDLGALINFVRSRVL